MPLPLALTLLLLGFALWWLRRPRGRWLALSGLLLLLAASWPPVGNSLLLPLENRYARLQEPAPDIAYVMVMGGSHAEDPRLPPSNRLNMASTYRLLEGVLQYHRHPGSTLVLAGGGGQEWRHAEVAADLARRLGVPEDDLLLLPQPRDTRQEALLLGAVVGPARVVVVTSASHMPRTLYWMGYAGVEAVAAPTDFIGGRYPRTGRLPSLEGLILTQTAWHEYLGLVWARIVGR